MIEHPHLPSVESLLQKAYTRKLQEKHGRALTLNAVREVLERIRSSPTAQKSINSDDAIIHQAESIINTWLKPSLLPVINATGVILHTNLGRAPLSKSALDAIIGVSKGYSTLEFDLQSGRRGSRSDHVERLLTRLTGAESALVVNNNAAAVLLVLSGLARHQRVIISRTQLVEVGGGFRIPDVMKESGAKLVEVGATNRVHSSDYETALQEPAALVMRAHHSNYKIVGFAEELGPADLVRIAHRHGAFFLDDLGSGAILDTSAYGLPHEPTVQDSLTVGADVVCFSGDKLFGGPQAGIILGKKEIIIKLRKHPLTRALRADKLCLAALSATIEHYLAGSAESSIPVWQMISTNAVALKKRALAWKKTLQCGEVIKGESTIGGGSLPEEILPTFLFCLRAQSPDRFVAELRKTDPPIIARIENGCVVFDPRTILTSQETDFLDGVKKCIQKLGN
jgi:L-seryl-tRNA(Ser) seleniumtransferase